MAKIKNIKDTVHGYIGLDEVYWQIIDTPEFQRLKWIEQISYRTLYPSARHDRFIHSLGVFHLGKIAFDSFINNGFCVLENKKGFLPDGFKEKSMKFEEPFLCACLLHDIGHAPFSHTFEAFFNYGMTKKDKDNKLNTRLYKSIDNSESMADYKKQFIKDYNFIYNNYKNSAANEMVELPKEHEIVSAILILEKGKEMQLSDIMLENLDLIIRAILGCTYQFSKLNNEQDKRTWGIKNCIIRLLNSSSVDVDKLDYITRDTYMSGYDNINIDNIRLLKSLTVIVDKNENIIPAFKNSALSIVNNVISAKNLQAKWIISHPSVVYEDYLMKKSFNEVVKLFIQKYCRKNDNKKTICNVDICNPEACQKYKCKIVDTDDFINKLFSIEALSLDGITIQGKVFKLLSDVDIISLMKEFSTKNNIINQFFSRNQRYKPIWKSSEEYIHLFKNDDLANGDILDKVYLLFKPIFNNLSEKSVSVDLAYYNKIVNDTNLNNDYKELKAALVFLDNLAGNDLNFVLIEVDNNFSSSIKANHTYFQFDEQTNSYSKYSDIIYDELVYKNEKSNKPIPTYQFQPFYIYSENCIERSNFIRALFEKFNVTFPSV